MEILWQDQPRVASARTIAATCRGGVLRNLIGSSASTVSPINHCLVDSAIYSKKIVKNYTDAP